MKEYFKNFTALNWGALAIGAAIVVASFDNGNFMSAIFLGAPLITIGIHKPLFPDKK